jgi:Gas vesicle synthesis protein GvpO
VAESKSSSGRKKRSSSSSRSGSSGSSRKRSSSGSRKSSGSSRSNGRSSSRRSARDVVGDAIKQVNELIGKPIESVTGMEKDGSDWTVTLEVLELSRIPNTTDVLGSYEVTLDRNGDVTGIHRTRRYPRAEAREE